ncbi:TPA: AbrB/MazE/SpoVT family DNA-binding domain-containing protein [Candidatus Bathyarchaeota archaeon]|nr:AbrB/MazE/SpoVT family DNA-binding domain-containing protein [Candidatus Bathyarchaeota archaeon]
MRSRKTRETIGIKIGDRLLVEVVGEKIVLRPIKASDVLARLSNISDKFSMGRRRSTQ